MNMNALSIQIYIDIFMSNICNFLSEIFRHANKLITGELVQIKVGEKEVIII